MRAYFEDKQNLRFFTGYFAALLLASFFLVGLIVTGWIALGQRANISRRDLNATELVTVAVSLLVGLAAVRTFYGLINREKASLAWAQWASLATIVLGLAIAMYGVLGATKPNATVRELNWQIVAIGVFVVVASAIAYKLSTIGTEDSPDRIIRIQLAESPSSGAIIGFIAILLTFSMAADKFLGPTSVASVLTGVSSKGIIAIGVTILMISGEFDLSVGSVLGVSSMVYLLVMTEGLQGAGPFSFGPQPVGIAAIIALTCACIMGFINGILLVTTRIPSFIVTLGTLFSFRAIVLVVVAGGRILRYYDYRTELPQVYIDRWLVVALSLIGASTLAYISYRIIPSYWNRFVDRWNRQHDNGSFGTLTAVVSGLWALIVMAFIVVVFVWLLLVAWMHIDRIETSTGLLFVALCLGLLVAGYFADQFRARTWNDFQEKRANEYPVDVSRRALRTGLGGNFLNSVDYSDYEPYSGAKGVFKNWLGYAISSLLLCIAGIILNFVIAIILFVFTEIFGFSNDIIDKITLVTGVIIAIAIILNFVTRMRSKVWQIFLDLLDYGKPAIAGMLIWAGVIVAFFVSLSRLFARREDSWQLGFFEIANGQWRFDLETVTRGAIKINIPTEANFRNAIVWWVLLVIIFQIILMRTRYGNSVFAVGGNIGAARAQGINASRVKVQNFMLVAFLVGLAGIMEVGYLPSIDPLKGDTWELDVIAMTVVGGALLTGGYGSIIGTMLGAMIFGMLGTGLVLVGMDPRMFQGVVGVTMIVAVVLNNASKRVRG